MPDDRTELATSAFYSTDKKVQLKDHFRRMDAALLIAKNEANRIKELAPVYWKSQGVLAAPRIERLREDVFS